ncbi:MAG: nitroreductase family protein [Desulfurococcales archaeon]|nr:nitroreductase family protein [Desulfurococcales archaeon]
MPCVVEATKRHRSIRAYSGPVEEEHVNLIIEAARRAPTAWNLMPVSIQAVTDPSLLEKLGDAVGGQEHVRKAPLFLVFSIDYAKVVEASKASGVEPAEPGLGHVVAALVDAGIMVGWAGLAAEDLGYGVAFIAVYGNPCRVAEILGLPPLVVPVVGLAIGKPGEDPAPRPRQPLDSMLGLNGYGKSPEEKAQGVQAVYGQRAQRLFSIVTSREGYLAKLSSQILECLRSRGFKAP